MDSNRDFVGAGACIGFTHLIAKLARMVSEMALGKTIITGRSNKVAISEHVHAAAISWTP